MKDARIEERVEELKTLIKRHDEALAIGDAVGLARENNPCDETLEKK